SSSAPTRPPSRASSGPRAAPDLRLRPRTSTPSSASAAARCSGRTRAAVSLAPLERSLPPDVDVGDEQDDQEDEELEEPEPRELVEDHGERVEKDDLDVEQDEEHRRQVEADGEALALWRTLRDAGLERD